MFLSFWTANANKLSPIKPQGKHASQIAEFEACSLSRPEKSFDDSYRNSTPSDATLYACKYHEIDGHGLSYARQIGKCTKRWTVPGLWGQARGAVGTPGREGRASVMCWVSVTSCLPADASCRKPCLTSHGLPGRPCDTTALQGLSVVCLPLQHGWLVKRRSTCKSANHA